MSHQAEKSQLTVLAEALAQSDALDGEVNSVTAGKNELAMQRAPRRIVLIPTTGKYESASKKPSLLDNEQEVVARCWGLSFDDAWVLHDLFFRAMREQADAGGLFWKAIGVSWDTDPDTGQLGHAFEVRFSVRLAVSVADKGRGQIDEYSITRT